MPGETHNNFFSGYGGLESVFDEAIDADGRVRPHWQVFAQELHHLGLEEFTRRWREAQQLIRQNGVTYNLHGDPNGMDRPWQLDPFPLVLSARESDSLERGLAQRARLLEAILADIYGPQQLLAEGDVPAELVYANPYFLRPCHGVAVPGRRYLHLIAFDLGRAPDGTFMILGDRTQCPSGTGYALENRIVLSRMLPEIFRSCNVQRTALFFRTLRETLYQLAPHGREAPRAVLLTPGPYNETYFEHAYLSRYLDLTLVEGGDLTVRDQRLYLKLIDGLEPVDIVLRRVDDDFCDPLELRGDSMLGVPGLIQVVRAGNVVIANALGSGLTQAAAFVPYLPALCRRLLDEELSLPSVPTFWCGDATALDHVLAQGRRMVIKAAFPSRRMEAIFGGDLSQRQWDELSLRIRAKPWEFVAQDCLNLSTAPSLTESGIVPHRVCLRAFLTADESSFRMMPGGLTRVTASAESMVLAMHQGGSSKDTWIASAAPVSAFSLLRGTERFGEPTRGAGISSRVADNLFWLGRHVQRADDLVRLLRGIIVRMIEKPGSRDIQELPTLLQALSNWTLTFPAAAGGSGVEESRRQPEGELFSLIFNGGRIGSVAYNFQRIARTASTVRAHISNDMRRILTSLPLKRPFDSDHPPTLSDTLELLDRSVLVLAGFGGIAMESMTRGHDWRFLDMGRKIERAAHLIDVLHCTLTAPLSSESTLLEALLEIADSSMTYRRRYRSDLQVATVLDLLLADESNPRSLVFQLQALKEAIDSLPHDPGEAVRSREQRMILSLLTTVQLADVQGLALADVEGRRHLLEKFLTELQPLLPQLADALSHHYLNHLPLSRQLAGPSS
jgi:uncharacterized circularly permuted ATP-grasp superfamily protein/uncharacterized alpha-E superfamily protein